MWSTFEWSLLKNVFLYAVSFFGSFRTRASGAHHRDSQHAMKIFDHPLQACPLVVERIRRTVPRVQDFRCMKGESQSLIFDFIGRKDNRSCFFDSILYLVGGRVLARGV